jgi:ParB family chromosome partitioning protein
MTAHRDLDVHQIPIERISVVNSRSRGREKFRQIVANISNIGLKKPVTVSPRPGKDGQTRYDLVCGQGRLEAYVALGQAEIPALLVDAPKDKLLLMGLAENLARRHRTSLEMAREILALQDRGYKVAEIAKKVDLDPTYIRGMIRLLKKSEERLLVAVERRQVPLSVAVAIAESNDQEIQQAMSDAYQKGELRGKALLTARRLIERRRALGKKSRGGPRKKEKVSANALLNAFRKEAKRQEILVGRHKACEIRLRFIVSALKQMLADEGFVNLLRAESLATLPQGLMEQIQGQGAENDPKSPGSV